MSQAGAADLERRKSLKIRLRKDLDVDSQQYEGRTFFVVKDPVGLRYYLDHNWVAGGSRETMRDAAQRAWRADLDAGRQTLLIVPTLPVTHQRRHESQMGPYAGIPRRSRPWTTCQVIFLLEMQITASSSKTEYASSARRTMSGLPRAVVSQMIALGCTARISSTSASP